MRWMWCVCVMACAAMGAQDVMTRPAERQPVDQAGQVHGSVKVVMEDGADPPDGLEVRAWGACRVTRVFRNGTVMFALGGIAGSGAQGQWAPVGRNSQRLPAGRPSTARGRPTWSRRGGTAVLDAWGSSWRQECGPRGRTCPERRK
jgi:hypothetical protein